MRYRELSDEPVATRTGSAASSASTPGVITGVPQHNVRPDVQGRTSGVSPAERAAALPRFADDVPRVAELTGWDLTDWQR